MADISAIRWVTFDVYSALFDYAGTLEPELKTACNALDETRVAALLALWRRQQLAVAMQHAMLERGHLSFRRATRLALDYALGRFDADLSDTVREDLVRAWDALSPWPEACAVLEQLCSRGYCLALLSNGDQDMLEALAARLPVTMDAILSAQRANACKPQPGMYRFALRKLGVSSEELLHVAGSATDVMGARAAGLHCVWSNRSRDTLLDNDYAPDVRISNLGGLPDLLAAQPAPALRSPERRP